MSVKSRVKLNGPIVGIKTMKQAIKQKYAGKNIKP